MTVEVQTLRGPLDAERLAWVARLYGPVDPKYGSLEFVRHQFVDNEFGWSVHAFALDDGVPVAHTAVVPFRARRGDRPLTAGKIEAVVVADSHRGQRTGAGKSIAIQTLQAAYEGGHEHGIDILFGLAPPRVSAIHARAGCRRVSVPSETYVLIVTPTIAGRDWTRKRRIAAVFLSVAQRLVTTTAHYVAQGASMGRGRARLGPPNDSDAELAIATASEDEWTVSGADAWSWYARSGVLQALDIEGRFGGRALLRVGAPETAVQIIAWRPVRSGLVPAVLLLGAAARIARRRRAPTLRFQPWAGSGDDGTVARACRLLGFARRAEAELVLHDGRTPLDAELKLTPFFYATF